MKQASPGSHPESNGDFFKAAFEAAPDAINPAAADLAGQPRDQMLGKNALDTPQAFDREVGEAFWAELQERGTLDGRYRFVGPNGRVLMVDFRARSNFLPGRHLIILRDRAGSRMSLSPREREVLTALAQGRTGAQVAQALVLSPETVRTHIRNAMEKLGARTRTHAIALAISTGEVDV
jgi:DNA-binding CsgD family transcriptional regulator